MTRSGAFAAVTRGCLRGSAVVGCLDHFEARYGRAAVHAVVAQLAPEYRAQVSPQVARLGLLPTKLYSYPFIGHVVRGMMNVLKVTDEDAFLRELAAAGMDRTLTTVNRVMLHYMLTPEQYAARAQEIWSLYHDSGVVTVLPSKPMEYRVQLTEWPSHDPIICRICVEARRRSLEHMGCVIIESRREQCQSWGHDNCTHVFRWSSLTGKVR